MNQNTVSLHIPVDTPPKLNVDKTECAKFRGSCAILGLVGLVPPCRRAFDGPKIFLVSVSWVSNFFW